VRQSILRGHGYTKFPERLAHISGECNQNLAVIKRPWEGIAAYCEPQNKVALGFVEWLNSKNRVIQRRCGLRNEEYVRLKIFTSTLAPLPRT